MGAGRRTRRIVVASLIAAATVAAGETGSWRRVTGPPQLAFPRDHGAHPDHRTEWWYLTGVVTGADGGRYGFQITFFRVGLDPSSPEPGSSKLRARQVLAAHLAIADISQQRFHHAERLRRVGGGLAGMSEEDLEVWLDDWTMAHAVGGEMAVTAGDRDRGIGLEIALKPERELVLHGDAGYSRKGPEAGNASVYLSWTRLAVTGEIEVGGSRIAVTGTAWFDHEWGTSTLGQGIVGWDWSGLRLDDGRDLMVFRLRRADGEPDPRSSGSLVGRDGRVTRLERDDIEIDPLTWWQSTATAGRYPVRWRLRLPGEAIDLEIRALLPVCELDGTATTGVIYWEGPVAVSGSHGGEGYVEMTGYAGSLEGRF